MVCNCYLVITKQTSETVPEHLQSSVASVLLVAVSPEAKESSVETATVLKLNWIESWRLIVLENDLLKFIVDRYDVVDFDVGVPVQIEYCTSRERTEVWSQCV